MVFVRVVSRLPVTPAVLEINTIEKSFYLDHINPSVVHNEIIKLNVNIKIHETPLLVPNPNDRVEIKQATVNDLVRSLLMQATPAGLPLPPLNIGQTNDYDFHSDNHLLNQFGYMNGVNLVDNGTLSGAPAPNPFIFYGYGLSLNKSHDNNGNLIIGNADNEEKGGNIEIKYGRGGFCYGNPKFSRKENIVINFHVVTEPGNIALPPLITQINQKVTAILVDLQPGQPLAVDHVYTEARRLRISELFIFYNNHNDHDPDNDRVFSIENPAVANNQFASPEGRNQKNSSKVAITLYLMSLRYFLIFVRNQAVDPTSWKNLPLWGDLNPYQKTLMQKLLGENPTLSSVIRQNQRLEALQDNLRVYLLRQTNAQIQANISNAIQNNSPLETGDITKFLEFSQQVQQVIQQCQIPPNITQAVTNLATAPRRNALNNLNLLITPIQGPAQLPARLHSFKFNYTPPNIHLNSRSGIDYYLVGPFNNWLGAGTVPPEIAPVPFEDDRWIMRKHSNQNNTLSCEIKLDWTGRDQNINNPGYYYQCKVVKYCQNSGYTIEWLPLAASHKFTPPLPPNHNPYDVNIPS